MPFHHRRDQPLEVLLATCVSGDGLGLGWEPGVDPSRLDIEALLLAARQHNLRPLLRERLGDGAADAAAGSSHERDAPGQVEPGTRGHGC